MTAQQRMQIQLDKQAEQTEDLFKSVREIKNMNLSNKAMFKGLILGFGLENSGRQFWTQCVNSLLGTQRRQNQGDYLLRFPSIL